MPVVEKKLQMVMHQPVTTTGNNVTARSMLATDVDDGDCDDFQMFATDSLHSKSHKHG